MTNRLRVAVVGAGIAREHLEGFRQLPQLFEVTALCCLDEDRGRALCQQFEIPWLTGDFDGLVNGEDIDVVDICTPPSLHYQMVRRAIVAGRHVICEKPLFASLAEVDAMAELLSRSHATLMPIFQYRYGKGLQKLRRLIGAGLAGRPILTTVETHWWRGPSYYEVPWRGKWRTELGGGLLGHAIHAHDMLTYIHGDIAEVFAHTATLVNPIEVEDTSTLSVKLANGSLAALSMTLGSRREISRLRFCFHSLVAESILEPYAFGRDPWRFEAGEPDHQTTIDAALAEVPDTLDGYARQFELLHAAIRDGGAPPVTLMDARRSLELVTAAYQSARSGRPTILPVGKDHPLYRGWAPG